MCLLAEIKERAEKIPERQQPEVWVSNEEKVRSHNEVGILANKKVKITHIYPDENRGIVCIVRRGKIERSIYSKFLMGLNADALLKIKTLKLI